ncbi:MAG: lytic transglycosylase domain-containing protein, partial [Burkholderiaceae bacterium]
YRIAGTASTLLVGAAYEAAETVKVDPLLILAVMAIESRFNPFAESAMGAQGLMQVMSRVHREKFDNHGGPTAALNPVANIQVGARILKDMIRVSGSVQGGLKLYVGAGNLETDGGYAAKVLAEYSRLQQVAAGKRVPTFTPPQVVEPAREADAAPVVSHAEQEPA